MTENVKESRVEWLRDLTIQGLRYAIPDAKVECAPAPGLGDADDQTVSVRMPDGTRFLVAVYLVR